MPVMPGFVGGHDVQRSLNLADNKCVNLYPTTNDAGTITAFYQTYGLSIYTSAASPFSGVYTASNGRAFAVSGTTLYEITSGGVLTSRGSVTSATVSKMSDNGIELILVNGTDGWLFTFATNALKKLSSLQANFTVTIASPAVFTSTNHGLVAGDAIQLSSTTGTVASDNLLTALNPATVSTPGITSTSVSVPTAGGIASAPVITTSSTANPDFIVSSTDGNFIYAANRTSNGIYQYVRDITSQKLSPLSPQVASITFQSLTIGQPSGASGSTITTTVTGITAMTISPDNSFIAVACTAYTSLKAYINGGLVNSATTYQRVILWLPINQTGGQLSSSFGVIWDANNPNNFAAGITGTSSPSPVSYEGIAISPDGLSVYATSTTDNAVYQFSRNTASSALTPLSPGSVSCTSPSRIVCAPDGSSVYAISASNKVFQYSRNLTTGLLSPLATPSLATGTTPTDIAISPDGKSVYVTNFGGNTVSQYSRDLATFLLTALTTYATGTGPSGLTISPDGASVYVANRSANTISMAARDSTTSLLSNLSQTTIASGNDPIQICITPDGKGVYASNYTGSSISQYSRLAPSSNIGLPTGLATLTTYYVIAAGLTANTFEVSTTLGGTAVNTSGVQAGVHTFTTLAGGFPNGCKTVSYINGRFVACQPNTQNFFVSDVLNGSVWQTVNVQTADSNPDNVVGQIALHNELIIFCEQTGETYYDSGVYPSPFQRNVSGIFEVGCIAPYSIAKIDNSVIWLGKNNTGQGVVYRLNGYTPVRLSTYAIEYAIQSMAAITDAQAFTYQQDGHHFYAITFPTGGRTFVFDVNTGLWHERQSVGLITPNAITLTQSATTMASNFAPWGMAWNGSVYVVVGQTGSFGAPGATNICYTSPDGITWTARTLPSTSFWTGVAWNGSVFCAITSGSAAATSPDGITWTARTMASANTHNSIVYGAGLFCVATVGGSFETSPDGITWTTRTAPAAATWYAITWTGTQFCAISINTSNCATSPDGITWTARTFVAGTAWSSIAWNGAVFVAVQNNNTTYATSPDGITWTSRTLPAAIKISTPVHVGVLNGVFAIFGELTNNVYFSADGVNWTSSVITGAVQQWSTISTNGTTFCILSAAPVATAISSSVSTSSSYGAWEAREYTFFDNKHLVTDALEGRIYYIDPNSYTDGGVPRKWIRSWRAPPSDMKRVNHHKLTLEFEAGVGNVNAPNPTLSLKYSNDGGHTFSVDNWRDLSMGTAGQYTKRVYWYRLGMTTGQPRIYELSGVSPVKTVLLNAYLE